MSLDTSSLKCVAMELCGTIVSQLADVACLQAPLLAGDYGRSYLASRKDGFFAELDFRTWGGKLEIGITVSVAFKPTPTRSTFDALIIFSL